MGIIFTNLKLTLKIKLSSKSQRMLWWFLNGSEWRFTEQTVAEKELLEIKLNQYRKIWDLFDPKPLTLARASVLSRAKAEEVFFGERSAGTWACVPEELFGRADPGCHQRRRAVEALHCPGTPPMLVTQGNPALKATVSERILIPNARRLDWSLGICCWQPGVLL